MPKLKRSESVVISEAETATTDSEMSEEEDDVQQVWEQAEDRVADMVDAIKAKLEKIAPGIGDRISGSGAPESRRGCVGFCGPSSTTTTAWSCSVRRVSTATSNNL